MDELEKFLLETMAMAESIADDCERKGDDLTEGHFRFMSSFLWALGKERGYDVDKWDAMLEAAEKHQHQHERLTNLLQGVDLGAVSP